MENLDKILRPPNPNDLNFIYSSWINSYNDNNFFNPIKGPAYYGYQKLLINKLLNQSEVSVICNPEDKDQIFGYAVYELRPDSEPIIHWLYIKYTFRKLGLARFLLDSIMGIAKADRVLITFKGTWYKSYASKFNHLYLPKLAWG
jgi:hypothetical protein